MTMNTQGRPTSPIPSASQSVDTVSGSKGLLQAEGLIFEIGTEDTTGVDLPKPKNRTGRLGGVARKQATGLPGLSEPQTVRHYMRLSQKNYAIDLGRAARPRPESAFWCRPPPTERIQRRRFSAASSWTRSRRTPVAALTWIR